MAKQKISIIEENPTVEEIQPVEPLPQVVAEDKIEEKEEPLVEKPADVPDISRQLSDEIAKAAKDETARKKLEDKKEDEVEESTDLFSDIGGGSGNSNLSLYIGLGILGIAGAAAFIYSRLKNKRSENGDDEQPIHKQPRTLGELLTMATDENSTIEDSIWELR